MSEDAKALSFRAPQNGGMTFQGMPNRPSDREALEKV